MRLGRSAVALFRPLLFDARVRAHTPTAKEACQEAGRFPPSLRTALPGSGFYKYDARRRAAPNPELAPLVEQSRKVSAQS